MDIIKNIQSFLGGKGKNRGRHPNERYASFDYCYNYFYSFYKQKKIKEIASKENLQISCLQLGFYLASWGMLRGSSFLLERSVKKLERVIKTISEMDKILWEIDVNKYTYDNINILLDCKKKIIESFGKDKPSDTLVTKIMLGVFANVPAFDQYFRKSFRHLGVFTFNKKSLINIAEFYEQNKKELNSFEIFTLDFMTSEETDIRYTKAKLIDMCGFIEQFKK